MKHLLSIADLTRDDVERILETAGALADVDEKLPTLKGKLVLSLFFESSTRTSSSFELAAKKLSADVMSLKAAGSSVDKGESLKDTVLTLAAVRAACDRRPPPADRRAATSSRAIRTPLSSTPATASTSTRPRRCSTSSRCGKRSGRSTGCTSRSSATSSTAASPAR